MTKYKVGDVAALFSKPKLPTTESGKKLQSLFEQYYDKRNKSAFQSSQEDAPGLYIKTKNEETADQSMSKKSKKRKFSTFNDSELNNEKFQKKLKKSSEENKTSFKRIEGKKEKLASQDFPRKKKKERKVNSFNFSLPISKTNDTSDNNIESPAIFKSKMGLKGNKQTKSFIKKSKHRNVGADNDNFSNKDIDVSNDVSNTDSFNCSDISLREEIKEILKNNPKKSKKIKNNANNFKQSSQVKVFKGENQNEMPKQKSAQVKSNAFAGNSPSEDRHEFKNSPESKQIPDFIRRPKQKNKANNDSFKKDNIEQSQFSNKAFSSSDNLFKSGNEENVVAENFNKKKFNSVNHTQNLLTKTSEQAAPDFIKLLDSDQDEVLKRTLFVGNLPVNTSRKALKKLFSPCGEIENIRYHGIETDKAKIFSENPHKSLNASNYAADSVPGFIVFKERKCAVDALCLSGTVFKDRHITVDFAVAAGTKKLYDDKRSIFIGNLPFDIQDESIWNAFMDCGRIEGVRVVRDKETGIGKGFGYILFSTVQAKVNALALEDLKIGGRIIRIKAVESNQKTKKNTNPPAVTRDTFKSRAIRFKKNNKSTSSRKSIKKLMKKEKTLHEKKKIAAILQKKK